MIAASDHGCPSFVRFVRSSAGWAAAGAVLVTSRWAAHLTERAIALVEKEPKPDNRDATPSNRQDTISVDHVGRVSVEVARKLYRSIGAYFGGQRS